MSAPNETPEALSADALASVSDPAALLARAWALEPLARWSERSAALDRLAELLDAAAVPAEPEGRSWQLELAAERAVDAGRMFQLDEALALTEKVMRDADRSHEIALGRAQLAAGQALAWTGTETATRKADRAFADAAERFAKLGYRDWQGSALLRCGYSVWFQSVGDIPRAAALIREALDTYEPGSPGSPRPSVTTPTC